MTDIYIHMHEYVQYTLLGWIHIYNKYSHTNVHLQIKYATLHGQHSKFQHISLHCTHLHSAMTMYCHHLCYIKLLFSLHWPIDARSPTRSKSHALVRICWNGWFFFGEGALKKQLTLFLEDSTSQIGRSSNHQLGFPSTAFSRRSWRSCSSAAAALLRFNMAVCGGQGTCAWKRAAGVESK